MKNPWPEGEGVHILQVKKDEKKVAMYANSSSNT